MVGGALSLPLPLALPLSLFLSLVSLSLSLALSDALVVVWGCALSLALPTRALRGAREPSAMRGRQTEGRGGAIYHTYSGSGLDCRT